MIATMNPSRRYVILGTSVFLALFLLSQIIIGPPRTIKTVKHTTHQIIKAAQQPLTLAESAAGFFQAIKLPITAPSYTDFNGKTFNLSTKPYWTKPLGKDILIVDIDTRQPTGYNQIFNETKMDWVKLGDGKYMDNNIGLTSEAVLNHYLYAQIHGYDYMFYQGTENGYQHHTWLKVHAIAEIMKKRKNKFVVFLDADVTVHHFQVPLEWLFNKWKIGPKTSMAMPTDVTREDCNTCDSYGNVMLNSGVIVAQQMPHTTKIFDAWRTCTNGTRYPKCDEWSYSWAHEQRALSEFIRYDDELNPDDNIRPIPCDDANGYPEKNDVKPDGMKFFSDCQGNFFQHHWLDGGKSIAKTAIGDSVMQSVSEALQKSLWDQKAHIMMNKTKEAEWKLKKEKEKYKTEEDEELEMWEAREQDDY